MMYDLLPHLITKNSEWSLPNNLSATTIAGSVQVDPENVPTHPTLLTLLNPTYHLTRPASVVFTATSDALHHAGKKLCGTVQRVTVTPRCVLQVEMTGQTASGYGTKVVSFLTL